VGVDMGGSYILTATVTNSSGSASDSINLTWGCDSGEEVKGGAVISEDEIIITADKNLSGCIWEEGIVAPAAGTTYSIIYICDGTDNSQQKGYFSFDISKFHGKTALDTKINFINIYYFDHPESFASAIDVRVFNYGTTLDASDFASRGVWLAKIPILDTPYTISGDNLKNELQNILDDSSRDYFQIELELNTATNNDGISDGVIIYCNEAELFISYKD
jgi:hypothetical protein